MTLAEKALWNVLRRNACCGVRFKRQVAIRDFVVDFCAMNNQLVIEVDGGIHDEQQEYDMQREKMLSEWGFTVLRFQNEEIFNDLPRVLQKIAETIGQISKNKTSNIPPPRARGGG